jgi:hypothetical protein
MIVYPHHAHKDKETVVSKEYVLTKDLPGFDAGSVFRKEESSPGSCPLWLVKNRNAFAYILKEDEHMINRALHLGWLT